VPDPAGVDAETRALLLEAARKRAEAERADAELEARERERESADRSAITTTVMTVFGLALLGSLVVLLLAGLFSGRWETLAPSVTDILKPVLLPILTLVLGYYFGRGGKG